MGCAKSKDNDSNNVQSVDSELDKIPAQHSDRHILNALDDFCLQKIFEYCETPEELLNIAETCTRFQENAKQLFPLLFKKIGIGHGTGLDANLCIATPRVHSILAVFGHLIDSISWCASDDLINDDQISEMIVRFCGRTLVKLSIENYSSKFPEEMQFSALEKLTLINSAPQNLHVHSTLKYLVCDHIGQTLDFWLQMKPYPNLESLQLKYVRTMTCNQLIEFLSHNQQQKTLDVRGSIPDLIICNSIVSCLSKLEKFGFTISDSKFDSFHPTFDFLSGLKRLKYLSIDGIVSLPQVAFVLAENNVLIEELCICLRPRTLENASALGKLRKITVEGLAFEELVILVQNQPSLEEIIIIRRFEEAQDRRNDIHEIKKSFLSSKNLCRITVTHRRLHPELFTPGIHLDFGRILDIVISKIKQVTFCHVDGGFAIAEVTFQLRQND